MSAKTKEQEELKNLVNLARTQGKAENQKEFAKMIQLDAGYLSQLLSGAKPITRQMLKRIRDAVAIAGVIVEGNGNATATGPGSTAQVFSGDLSALIKEMGEMRRSYEELQRAKDKQISECMQLLKDAMAKPKK